MELKLTQEEIDAVKMVQVLGRKNALVLLNIAERMIVKIVDKQLELWSNRAEGLKKELIEMESGMKKTGLLEDKIDVKGIQSITVEEEVALGNMVRHARKSCEHRVHCYCIDAEKVESKEIEKMKDNANDVLIEIERGSEALVRVGAIHEKFQEEVYR